EARQYLAAARDQMAARNERPSATPVAASGQQPVRYGLQPNAESNKAFAQKLLDRARQYEQQGDVRSATSLARQAEALPADWQPGEQSPGQYLAQLDESSRPRDL